MMKLCSKIILKLTNKKLVQYIVLLNEVGPQSVEASRELIVGTWNIGFYGFWPHVQHFPLILLIFLNTLQGNGLMRVTLNMYMSPCQI